MMLDKDLKEIDEIKRQIYELNNDHIPVKQQEYRDALSEWVKDIDKTKRGVYRVPPSQARKICLLYTSPSPRDS